MVARHEGPHGACGCVPPALISVAQSQGPVIVLTLEVEITYGEWADKVRTAMRVLDIGPDEVRRVEVLVWAAMPDGCTDIDRWTVAALIVPNCSMLGPIPG